MSNKSEVSWSGSCYTCYDVSALLSSKDTVFWLHPRKWYQNSRDPGINVIFKLLRWFQDIAKVLTQCYHWNWHKCKTMDLEKSTCWWWAAQHMKMALISCLQRQNFLLVLMYIMTEATFLTLFLVSVCIRSLSSLRWKIWPGLGWKKESLGAEADISKGTKASFPWCWEQGDFFPDTQVGGEAQQMWFALNKDHRFFLITTLPFYGVSVNYCQFRHL